MALGTLLIGSYLVFLRNMALPGTGMLRLVQSRYARDGKYASRRDKRERPMGCRVVVCESL